MKHKKLVHGGVLLFTVVFILSGIGVSADKAYFSMEPKARKDGRKWRIGYLEGGPWIEYPQNLKAVVLGLKELGWLDISNFPVYKDEHDASALWKFVCDNAKSSYVEFVKDAFWSSGWNDELREQLMKNCIYRLNIRKDIDLMLALGTRAGQDLATNKISVPTVVIAASDPVAAKIIKSIDDSGYDHLHARVDPTRYVRQIELFHDIIEFKKLGIAYENTDAGKSYAALTIVEKVARKRGFEIISCHSKDEIAENEEEATNSVIKCYRDLAPKVDAVYIVMQRGITFKTLPKVLAPLIQEKIPTFSQYGSDEVKYGVLLSIAQAGFKYVGRYTAEVIAKIFNGAKPRDLDQVFEDPPKIAINLKTAIEIGYDPPVDILGAADEIYQTTRYWGHP
jgi:ABC-type uncharacterized transport system substrate-binding protein